MMENLINREYVRTDNWSVTAKVCRENDSANWSDVEMPNIAAGGALIVTETLFETGEVILIDMEIDPVTPGISRKIPIESKGVIRGDRGTKEGKHIYSVEFKGMSSKDRTRLDELVRMTNYSLRLLSESALLSQ